MPNELGLLTKQEAKNLRDLNLQPGADLIKEIAEVIRQTQLISFSQSEATFNKVMTTAQYTEVEKYFKNTMSYTVDPPDANGLPTGQTRLTRISWA